MPTTVKYSAKFVIQLNLTKNLTMNRYLIVMHGMRFWIQFGIRIFQLNTLLSELKSYKKLNRLIFCFFRYLKNGVSASTFDVKKLPQTRHLKNLYKIYKKVCREIWRSSCSKLELKRTSLKTFTYVKDASLKIKYC